MTFYTKCTHSPAQLLLAANGPSVYGGFRRKPAAGPMPMSAPLRRGEALSSRLEDLTPRRVLRSPSSSAEEKRCDDGRHKGGRDGLVY